ncbi:probable serine/threonine-protein kinase DDB_G0282963 isoform X2 [Sitophilus oryzae]|uniref:Probable serine/threonine-protein kinase DDB_G0282963 isoform X2 n=1 Tax=Sitophilus oryzae TaxID=7048 RepID=A0A6J2XZ61_SITOR|nr:probable serine/threonine-protein kinase DDB_G0282963 isoform X2 [Sitophilus oryzae]
MQRTNVVPRNMDENVCRPAVKELSCQDCEEDVDTAVKELSCQNIEEEVYTTTVHEFSCESIEEDVYRTINDLINVIVENFESVDRFQDAPDIDVIVDTNEFYYTPSGPHLLCSNAQISIMRSPSSRTDASNPTINQDINENQESSGSVIKTDSFSNNPENDASVLVVPSTSRALENNSFIMKSSSSVKKSNSKLENGGPCQSNNNFSNRVIKMSSVKFEGNGNSKSEYVIETNPVGEEEYSRTKRNVLENAVDNLSNMVVKMSSVRFAECDSKTSDSVIKTNSFKEFDHSGLKSTSDIKNYVKTKNSCCKSVLFTPEIPVEKYFEKVSDNNVLNSGNRPINSSSNIQTNPSNSEVEMIISSVNVEDNNDNDVFNSEMYINNNSSNIRNDPSNLEAIKIISSDDVEDNNDNDVFNSEVKITNNSSNIRNDPSNLEAIKIISSVDVEDNNVHNSEMYIIKNPSNIRNDPSNLEAIKIISSVDIEDNNDNDVFTSEIKITNNSSNIRNDPSNSEARMIISSVDVEDSNDNDVFTSEIKITNNSSNIRNDPSNSEARMIISSVDVEDSNDNNVFNSELEITNNSSNIRIDSSNPEARMIISSVDVEDNNNNNVFSSEVKITNNSFNIRNDPSNSKAKIPASSSNVRNNNSKSEYNCSHISIPPKVSNSENLKLNKDLTNSNIKVLDSSSAVKNSSNVKDNCYQDSIVSNNNNNSSNSVPKTTSSTASAKNNPSNFFSKNSLLGFKGKVSEPDNTESNSAVRITIEKETIQSDGNLKSSSCGTETVEYSGINIMWNDNEKWENPKSAAMIGSKVQSLQFAPDVEVSIQEVSDNSSNEGKYRDSSSAFLTVEENMHQIGSGAKRALSLRNLDTITAFRDSFLSGTLSAKHSSEESFHSKSSDNLSKISSVASLSLQKPETDTKSSLNQKYNNKEPFCSSLCRMCCKKMSTRHEILEKSPCNSSITNNQKSSLDRSIDSLNNTERSRKIIALSSSNQGSINKESNERPNTVIGALVLRPLNEKDAFSSNSASDESANRSRSINSAQRSNIKSNSVAPSRSVSKNSQSRSDGNTISPKRDLSPQKSNNGALGVTNSSKSNQHKSPRPIEESLDSIYALAEEMVANASKKPIKILNNRTANSLPNTQVRSSSRNASQKYLGGNSSTMSSLRSKSNKSGSNSSNSSERFTAVSKSNNSTSSRVKTESSKTKSNLSQPQKSASRNMQEDPVNKKSEKSVKSFSHFSRACTEVNLVKGSEANISDTSIGNSREIIKESQMEEMEEDMNATTSIHSARFNSNRTITEDINSKTSTNASKLLPHSSSNARQASSLNSRPQSSIRQYSAARSLNTFSGTACEVIPEEQGELMDEPEKNMTVANSIHSAKIASQKSVARSLNNFAEEAEETSSAEGSSNSENIESKELAKEVVDKSVSRIKTEKSVHLNIADARGLPSIVRPESSINEDLFYKTEMEPLKQDMSVDESERNMSVTNSVSSAKAESKKSLNEDIDSKKSDSVKGSLARSSSKYLSENSLPKSSSKGLANTNGRSQNSLHNSLESTGACSIVKIKQPVQENSNSRIPSKSKSKTSENIPEEYSGLEEESGVEMNVASSAKIGSKNISARSIRSANASSIREPSVNKSKSNTFEDIPEDESNLVEESGDEIKGTSSVKIGSKNISARSIRSANASSIREPSVNKSKSNTYEDIPEDESDLVEESGHEIKGTSSAKIGSKIISARSIRSANASSIREPSVNKSKSNTFEDIPEDESNLVEQSGDEIKGTSSAKVGSKIISARSIRSANASSIREPSVNKSKSNTFEDISEDESNLVEESGDEIKGTSSAKIGSKIISARSIRSANASSIREPSVNKSKSNTYEDIPEVESDLVEESGDEIKGTSSPKIGSKNISARSIRSANASSIREPSVNKSKSNTYEDILGDESDLVEESGDEIKGTSSAKIGSKNISARSIRSANASSIREPSVNKSKSNTFEDIPEDEFNLVEESGDEIKGTSSAKIGSKNISARSIRSANASSIRDYSVKSSVSNSLREDPKSKSSKLLSGVSVPKYSSSSKPKLKESSDLTIRQASSKKITPSLASTRDRAPSSESDSNKYSCINERDNEYPEKYSQANMATRRICNVCNACVDLADKSVDTHGLDMNMNTYSANNIPKSASRNLNSDYVRSEGNNLTFSCVNRGRNNNEPDSGQIQIGLFGLCLGTFLQTGEGLLLNCIAPKFNCNCQMMPDRNNICNSETQTRNNEK